MTDPDSDDKVEVGLELTDEELRFLEGLAKERGTSIDQVVELILEQVITLEEDLRKGKKDD